MTRLKVLTSTVLLLMASHVTAGTIPNTEAGWKTAAQEVKANLEKLGGGVSNE